MMPYSFISSISSFITLYIHHLDTGEGTYLAAVVDDDGLDEDDEAVLLIC
jgi:hypothetical protein